jgi:hypothetical protein
MHWECIQGKLADSADNAGFLGFKVARWAAVGLSLARLLAPCLQFATGATRKGSESGTGSRMARGKYFACCCPQTY